MDIIKPQSPELLPVISPTSSEPFIWASQSPDGVGSLQDEPPVAPDQFIEGFETSRWEIWAYYTYYIGNSGLTLFQFAPTAFQNLLAQAAGESGLLRFAGSDRTVNSIVLLSNGISFSIQVVLFLVLGSFADFGTWRPYILTVQTVIGVAIGFGWLGVHTPEKWELAAGMYIVGLVVYQIAYTYWLAAFPALARNTPALREQAEKYNAGTISRETYDAVDSMKRNEICNMALYVSGIGALPVIAIAIGILYAVNSNGSEANNNWGLSVLMAWGSAVWLTLAIPWFVLEKKRPGQPLPPGKNIVSAGLWQLRRAATNIWKLKQSLAYLIGFFFLGDSLNTTVTVVQTLQNEVQHYNTILLAELLLVSFVGQCVGMFVFMRVQNRWRISTKTMLNAVAVFIIILDCWGMIGVWTQTIGFHHSWEFWLYQVWYGLLVCPWYSYSQTMISEVTPRGKDFLFFSLFNIVGKASSFIGPYISSAIIDASPTHNNSAPFYFLTAVSIASFIVIYLFVDLAKSRQEQEKFLNEEQAARLVLLEH